MGTGAGSLTGRRSDDYTGQRHTVKLEVIRVIDDDGKVVHPEREPALTGDELRRLFRTMLLVRLLDERMLLLQRQGRMGFYLTSLGEEATHIGAAHALRMGDWLYPAYREIGAALYRGYPLNTFMCQLFGNADDPVKGRQMPVHHSVRRLNFVSVSSPVGSHIPHAVGDRLGGQAAEDATTSRSPSSATARPRRRPSTSAPPSPRSTRCRPSCSAATTAGPSRCRRSTQSATPVVRPEGDRLRDAGRSRRRQRSAGGDPRGGRGGGARPARRGADADRGPHLSQGRAQHLRRSVRLSRSRRAQGLGAPRSPRSHARLCDGARASWTRRSRPRRGEEINAEIRAALAHAEGRPPKPPLASLVEDVYAEPTPRLREELAALEAEIARHGPKRSPHG